ncbi:hypothetical protein [Prolixibacter sp. SD074]|uniref:hypothetical protein n=1 Tax=Prolixibacter sp. SD074 TaxID=2652391 RepID=UPI00127E45CA|nr:hypothetical protein [Prolixibacter sp. SD074]GET29934.1 hypothetical protein SD074_21360 [Prolixibacter sp. SD074]
MKNNRLEKLRINKTIDFTIIGEAEQKSIKGGYTVAQLEQMLYDGTWEGGYVDGMGYVFGTVTITATEHCTICETFDNYGSFTSGGWYNEAGNRFFHMLGLHDNQSTTYYTYSTNP